MKIKTVTALVPMLLVATSMLQGAQAQDKASRRVTRDELRACMDSEVELSARRKATEARNHQVREENAAIRAEAQQMAEDQKTRKRS